MRPEARVLLFSFALAGNLAIAFAVFDGRTSHALAVLWFVLLFPFALATRMRPAGKRSSARGSAALLLFAACLPVLVRLAHFDDDRLHTDEFITAYFSATHDFRHDSFFASMPGQREWNARFPTPFFFLQRIFLELFGKSLFAMRLSVQPFVAAVSVALYLTVREIFDRRTAVVAVCLYAFLAISVYLETFGFMFISSTAAFLAFFYFTLRASRTGDIFEATVSGMACGFCYLTYYSSYLALPFLVAIFSAHAVRTRSRAAVENLLLALGGTLIVVSPFVAAGLRSGESVTRRANEISLLSGEWSPYRDAILHGASRLSIVKNNLVLALRALSEDGLGGHGGYDFGRRALLERFSLFLLLCGGAATLLLMFRRPALIFVVLVIGAAFFGGIVLTIPPPAYHRFSIAFPFLVIVMSVPFFLLGRAAWLPASARYALTGGALLLFACRNERQIAEAAIRDPQFQEFRLSRFLNARYPGRTLYVAAFPGFGFHRIYYFAGRESRERPNVVSGYHVDLLPRLDPQEKYVYVMIFANEFQEQFRTADPRGRLFRFSPSYSVFAN